MIPRQTQYQTLLPHYEAEEARYDQLGQRATILLSLISGLTLFAGVNSDAILDKLLDSAWTLALLTISGVFLLLSALASTISLAMRNYKDICNVEVLVVDIEENDYDEEDLYSVLLANMADAVRHNRSVNDSRANWLTAAHVCLCLAVSVFIAVNVLAPLIAKGIVQ